MGWVVFRLRIKNLFRGWVGWISCNGLGWNLDYADYACLVTVGIFVLSSTRRRYF